MARRCGPYVPRVCHHVLVCVGVGWVQLGHVGEHALCGAWARPEVGCKVHWHGLGRIGEGCECIGEGCGHLGEGHGHIGKGCGCIGKGHGFIGEGHGWSECMRHVECIGEGHGWSECVRHVGMDHGGCTCMGIGRGLGGACGRHRTKKTAAPAHLCLAVTLLIVSTASHPLLVYAAFSFCRPPIITHTCASSSCFIAATKLCHPRHPHWES